MSGGSTIATSDTKIEAMKFQSSAYGAVLPVVYGVTRISGNLMWYGGFKAIPHTSTQSAGGKGGSVKTQTTTYTYQAAVIMGLCEGDIAGVAQVWRGKTLYQGGNTPAQIVTVTEPYTIPVGGGTFTVSHSSAFAADNGVRAPTGGGANGDSPYMLSDGYDYSRVGGAYTFPSGWFDGLTVQVTYQYTVAGAAQTSLQQLGMSLAKGAVAQSAWSYLATYQPVDSSGNPVGSVGSQSVGYSGISYVYAATYDLGTAATVDNHNFEVQAQFAYSLGSTVPDVDPSQVAYDLLTNTRYGTTFPASRLGSTGSWSTYCKAAGILMSPAFTEQAAAAEVLNNITKLTNTAIVASEGIIKFIPYGDASLTGNGVTYTPNLTPIYDLTSDHFLGKENPVKVVRKPQADAYNHIQIEFLNRANQYNNDIAEAKDQANIDIYGLRAQDVIQAHWICDAAVARTVAQLLLQRALYIRNTYEFLLPPNFALLEPMDLVTLTDTTCNLDKTTVRLTEVTETAEGDWACVAEEFPLGTAAATLYPTQGGSGFAHNYNTAPGAITTVVPFEAPVELTTTGLEVYVAVNSTSSQWGGCRVWVSTDGSNYRQIARISGGSRCGTITGAISGSSLPVNVGSNNQLTSGSITDAAALATLCYIGGATPEYVSYTTATLTGAGAYTLNLTTRGAYASPQNPHAAADPFVRVDTSVAKSGPLDLSMIGKTIYFKFTSFNVYGGGEEPLGAVAAYPYTINGYMAKLPPSAPTGFSVSAEPFGIRAKCNQNPEPDVNRYEYRVGAAWASAVPIEPNGGTSYLWQIQTLASYTLWVAAVDALGNYSTPVSASIALGGPVVGSLASTVIATDIQLTWTSTAGSFSLAGYEVRYGASWGAGTLVQFVQANKYTETVKWGGSRTYWVAPLDVKGNYGTPVSTVVTINPPGAVTNQRAEVVDNNALLYWLAPATGDLPVDRYEVRKGASWAAGTVVGSNGNSTFTAIFEQQSGVYTYLVNAYDSAGTSGTPVNITATINQPPDYILRNNFNSTLNGTLTNMYLENGALYGPRNISETWAGHYTTNSWASPQDQVNAGFPIYAEPSVTSGSYVETMDYGVALPATIVTVTLSSTVLGGAVTATPTISWSNDNVTYTSATVGVNQVLAPSGFRYVRVKYDFTCTAGANLIQVTGINIKLANKLKTDSGRGIITTAATGVVVPFNVPFIDADTPICQAEGATPLTPVVDFTDAPNPTSFTVYLYNSSGTKVTGSFSWTARGY